VRSLRLDPDLDEKLQRAAAIKGESVSEFIRHAAEERADETLAERRSEAFADVAGVVHGGGGRARHSGEAFTNVVARGPVPR
jgi:hypothetical protein